MFKRNNFTAYFDNGFLVLLVYAFAESYGLLFSARAIQGLGSSLILISSKYDITNNNKQTQWKTFVYKKNLYLC